VADKNVFEVPDLREIKPPPQSGRLLLAVLIAVALLGGVFSSFYQVEPEQVGVVLRFGQYTGSNTPPGLHFKLPFGIDRVYKVPVQRQLTQEYGFRTPGLPVLAEVARTDPKMESSMLTGDLNTVVVEWVVQYRIVDPFKYLFRVRNVDLTFRDMTEAVAREVVGDRTVDEVITVGRQEITIVVKERLQELCDLYETGIQVDQVVLQDVTPPGPVKPAFNAVNQAEQEKEKLINEAQSEYNKVVPRARGEAQQTVLNAEGYALDRVNRARGEAARFEAVYEQYRQAPEVTRQRIYLETLNSILPTVGRKIVVDDEIRGILPLLNLDSGPRARSTAGQGGE
jgi:membrane protease subunit HflK